jgi:hypothetical protein
VHMNLVLHSVVAIIVCFAKGKAFFQSGSCHR